MLDSYKNRHGYMLAFGVTVNSCVDVLFGTYERVIGKAAAARAATYPSYLSGVLDVFYLQWNLSKADTV